MTDEEVAEWITRHEARLIELEKERNRALNNPRAVWHQMAQMAIKDAAEWKARALAAEARVAELEKRL